MKQLKTIFLVMSLFLVACVCRAQNNQYKIDDSCYNIYRQADSLLGTDTAMVLIDRLHRQAMEVHDEKARTLALVLRLRNLIRQGKETEVLTCFNSLKDISLATGYPQYYFYAYQLVSVYYFNNGQKTKGLDYALKMHDDAVKMDSEYGLWYSSRHLAELYWYHYRKDYARKFYQEAAETYEKSDDPTIKVQSMSRVYAYLAFTYDFGTREYELNVEKALETSRISIDTLLVDYCLACNAAVKKDFAAYNRYKGACISNPLIKRAHKDGDILLSLTDKAIKGDWHAVSDSIPRFGRLEDLTYLSNLASAYGNIQVVRECYQRITDRLTAVFDDQINQALLESEVMLENQKLTQRVIEQKTKLNGVLIAVIIFMALVTAFVGCLTYIYIRALRKAKNEADAASRMKTHFVQNMSHEIRTPLNAVVGYSQLLALEDGILTPEEKNEYISYITNNSSMLMMLIDDILDLSDIDSGNYRMSIGECACNEICRKAMKTVECRVPPGVGFEFVSDVSDQLSIMSDERRVQQVIINYLTNSCKHTSEGRIVLSCTIFEKPGYVTFAVSDTGTGIPAEEAEHIFKRFSKLDKFKQGSGLGLNICMLLADKLGGIVELDKNYGRCIDNAGRGARFLFHLPLENDPKQDRQ
ncbi:MAG: ATP-binding protein [Candidatus Cryptobacteroides sp.]